MKVVDSAAMAAIDRAAQEDYGIPGPILMENAGLKSYLLLKRRYWHDALPEGPCVFVVGKGNNGGDALVIARQLYLDGYRKGTVVTGAAADKAQLEMCRKLRIPVAEWPDAAAREAIATASIIVDGLTGTGIRGALRPPMDEIVAAINASMGFTVAVDVPSGIGDQYRRGMPAVKADATVTMGLPKLALYLPYARPLCGEINVVPIGFPPDLVEADTIPGTMLLADDMPGLLPRLPPEAYKNVRGTVCVFAGSVGTSGAAVLAANAAAHSRAGLVTLFADREVYAPIASQLASVMVRPVDYEEEPSKLKSPVAIESFGARVVGPGWGRGPERRDWLKAILSSGPGVLDADGLTLLAEDATIERPLPHPWVLTPHPGEFSRLIGTDREAILSEPLPHLLSAAQELGSVIVLKSHVTFVASPAGDYWLLDGMNPALGTGGSGDVLAGLIGGLLAGGLSAEAAACAGVKAHHLAGIHAFAERGWFSADELIPYLSREVR